MWTKCWGRTEQSYEELKWSEGGNLGTGLGRESHSFPRSDDYFFWPLITAHQLQDCPNIIDNSFKFLIFGHAAWLMGS